MTLDELAIKFGSDKATRTSGKLSPAGYAPIYESFFARFVKRPIRLLEIGVYEGASLKMWEEFFPEARIFGVDIDEKCRQYSTARTSVVIGDQADPRFLRDLVKQAGGAFDIVVDDGGHYMRQHGVSLETLFPYLACGGLYCIEDLHTSYWSHCGGGLGAPGATIEYLKDLVDVLNFSAIPKDVLTILSRGLRISRLKRRMSMLQNVKAVHFYKSLAIIEKGAGTNHE